MMFVVLVGPPGRSEAGRKGSKVPHLERKFVNSMDVVMTQPSSRRHGECQQNGCHRRDSRRSDGSSNDKGSPNSQQFGFVDHVSFEPTFLLELTPQLAEGHLNRRVGFGRAFKLLGPVGRRLGKSLPHAAGLARMECVHYLRGISASIVVNPVLTGGMRLSPIYSCVYPFTQLFIIINAIIVHHCRDRRRRRRRGVCRLQR